MRRYVDAAAQPNSSLAPPSAEAATTLSSARLGLPARELDLLAGPAVLPDHSGLSRLSPIAGTGTLRSATLGQADPAAQPYGGELSGGQVCIC